MEAISRPSVPLTRSERRNGAAVAAGGFVFLMLPRLSGWSALHVHKEDGSIFLQDFLARGWPSTFDTYTGYLHVLARVLVGIAASVTAGNPAWFPLVVGLLVSLVRVAIFWLVYRALIPYASNTRWALAAAATVLVLPAGQWEVLGNVTNLRWFLDAAAVFALLVVSRRPGLIILASALTVFAALGDPLTLLIAPLALLRLWRSRGIGRMPAICYSGAAAIHVALLHAGARGIELYPLHHPVGAVEQWVVRGPVTATFGVTGAEGLVYVGGVGLAMVAAVLPAYVVLRALRLRAFRASSGLLVVLLGTYALAILAATLLFAPYDDIALQHWYSPAVPTRYGVAPALLLLPAVVLCAGAVADARLTDRRGYRAGWLLATVMLGAVILDFRGDRYNTQGPGWDEAMRIARGECTQGVREVTVRVTPTGVPIRWEATVTCHWVRG